jgi:hypothetical protein
MLGRGRGEAGEGGGAAVPLIWVKGDCEQTGLHLPPVLVSYSSHTLSFGLSFTYLQDGCEILSPLIMDQDNPNNYFKQNLFLKYIL